MRPFTQIQLRFALLSVLLTGLILLAACVLAFQNSLRQAEENFQAQLSARFAVMENQLRTVSMVSETALYRFEAENDVWVSLYDNGLPVNFRHHSDGAHRAALMAEAEGLVNWSSPYTEEEAAFVLLDENDGRQFVRFASFRTSRGDWCGILMIQSGAALSAQIGQLRLVWGLVFAGGLLAQGAVGLLMGRLAAAPALQAHQKQARFMASAGHELKSPLAVIQSSAEMVLKDSVRTAEYVGNITAETARMNRLVEDLLVLCGGDTARLGIKTRLTDLEVLLPTIHDRFLPLAERKGYRLFLTLQGERLPCVWVDEDRVVQLLGNLLSNAFAYATPATAVTLFARLEGRYLALGVSDEGPGLSRADKARVMERFYRGQQSHTDKSHFGLGLSVAREIAGLHRGRLVVRNSAAGGSAFVFLLPLDAKNSANG